ncbi:MAG TPA: DUF4149 domain-containing protein [Isosphaeraceae bacterium]|jgi:hypothetical protein
MPWLLLALRSLAIVAYAVWVGGFTFYGLAVIPILHDELDRLQAGQITQRVTDWLNLIGLGTILLWWVLAWAERRNGGTSARCFRIGLLAISTLLLAFLAVDHEILDDRLARYGLEGFYERHRVYLIASTAQWVVNLGMIPVTLLIWKGTPDERRTS